MITMDTNLRGVENCPNCGVNQPNLAYASHVAYPFANNDSRPCWVIYQCSACSDLVAALSIFEISRLDQFRVTYLKSNPKRPAKIIPDVKAVNSDIPSRAKTYLEQALKSLNAPDGAVMLAGSAVDAMLKEAGYTAGSVYDRIKKAVDDHVLTPSMAAWAHSVRLESNKPRHADIDDPHATKELAELTISFAEALGEYLFALPARIERGNAAAKEASTHLENGSGDDPS